MKKVLLIIALALFISAGVVTASKMQQATANVSELIVQADNNNDLSSPFTNNDDKKKDDKKKKDKNAKSTSSVKDNCKETSCKEKCTDKSATKCCDESKAKCTDKSAIKSCDESKKSCDKDKGEK
jgi:hypothetical protein